MTWAVQPRRWPCVTSGAIALTLLFFAAFFHNLPEPVLGAIVLMAASRLVRLQELRRLRIESRAEFWTAMVACLGVLSFGLLDGLLLAAVGSLVMLIAQTSRPEVVVLGRDRSGHFVSRVRNPGASDTPGALVVRSTSTWLYYNAEHIRRKIVDMIDGAPAKISIVVLDFSSVPAVDITAGVILRGLVRALKDRGIRVEIAELRDEVVENLKIIGADQDLSSIVAHRTIDDCLAASSRN